MVRETRHLWVGNLPENIREDRIREHFKRYGRVQSVKLLPRVSEAKTGEVSMACTVAFMDIKSASKAHNAELKIDDRTLNTEYHEPAAIPSAASPRQGTPPPYSTSPGSTRFPNGHGSSDEHGFPDSAPGPTRFYDRSTSSGGVAPTSAPEGGSGTCRGGRNRDRFRGGGGHRGAGVWGTGYESSRYNNSNERSQSETTGYNSAPSDINDRRNSENVRKKAKSRSGSRSPSPNGSTSSRSPSRSRSRSSSSSSSSSTSRDTSSTSSPRSRRHRHHKKSSQCNSDDRRPLAICVRNLPVRSSDTSLKDGLFHEYKKHGKVTWVKIVGQNADRHAIVCFKKPEDAEKALEVSYDKLFFGCKIEVAPYTVCDIDEVEFRYESEIDEYNPKATRTLFIGNLEKDVTASDLRKHFDQFGEIIEIDIKKQGAVSSYAFCQYSDIVSVVKAIRKMDGEHLGNNRIKLGFGKSMAYNCVWIDGVNENVNEKYLRIQFEPFGVITKCIMDREKGQALIFYEHVSQAQLAVNKMRGFVLKNTKLQVDFASRECQECFFERLEKQGAVFEDRRDSSSRSFESSAPTRISRYDTPTRPRTSSYSSRSSVAAVASPGTPGNATPRGGRARVTRYYDYEDYGALDSRHVSHRSYDEYSQGSAASHEDPYDPYDHAGYLHDSPGHLDSLEVRVVQTLVEAVPYAPHDIRNLQKERVHLLEQLEECPSSGDELISPKKRLKLDLLDPSITGDVIIEANRDHNRKVMEVRRLSESTLRHHSRRPSVDNKYGHYAPHTVGCKRRRTGGSDGGTRSGGHSHYAEHSDGSDHGGSRPGTPLCDENPEFPPGEPPKRTTREREGPLMLPLPKWAAQVRGTPEFQRGTISVAGIKGQKEHVNPLASPPPAATSPRVSHHHTRPPSPSHIVPPPASPPPRPPSLSSNSSDSDGASGSPSLEERIKSLDEKYEKWSGSRALSAAGNDALALLDANREKFRLRHKLLEIQDLKEVQPSEIVKSVMAKRSVFDEDLKRLESVGEKYEPKEFGLFSNRLMPIAPASVSTPVSTITTPAATSALKLTTVSSQLPKTPTMLSPRSAASALPIPASRGLQYPFPSHPPMQMSPAPPAPPTAPAVSQVPIASVTSTVITAPPATSTSTSVTARGSNLGENRLKPLANVPGDLRTSSVKNRSVATVVSEVSSTGKVKSSEKIVLRRNSSSTSPRADVKTRRNSDTSARRIDESEKCEKAKSEEQKLIDKAKEELEKQQREQEEKERVEKERIEKEKQEKERLERERKEKERLERESELEKQRLEKERLEKERIQREKEKAEKERLEKEKEKERERLRLEKEKAAKLEKEKAEKERLEKERLEQERREKERQEKERIEKEKLEKEKLEIQRLENLEKEKLQKEKEEQERKEREERELHEKLEKERKEIERKENEERDREREREQKTKEEEHRLAKEKDKTDRRKSEDRGSSRHKDSDNHHERSSKHRENHSETKHRENNTHHAEKQQHEKSSTKEPKEDKSSNREDGAKTSSKESNRESHEHRRESHHENSRHENVRAQIERDAERRKESIKENRDNNIYDKHKHVIEAKDPRDRAVVETRHMSLDLDKNQILDPSKDPNKRKERNNSLPANLGLKRRMSSHEILESIEESKKIKLGHEHKKVSERRESKDSSKSDEKSKKSKHKNNSSHEKHNNGREDERRKEKEKEREERHKKHKLEKQKSKSKSREKDSKEARESPVLQDNQPSMSDKDFLAKLNLRSNEDIEKEKQKKEKEVKEKRKELLVEPEKHSDDFKVEDKPKKERQPSFDAKSSVKSPQEDAKLMEERKMQKKERIRKMTGTSDSDSDEPKKHSIFDIVDDGPPYISMYDKVKARSCKNMQKQEEEKRQEKIKAKFSQLKLSRARREEKKRSTSWDEDSDSEKDPELKSRRSRKVLDSSDESQERKIQKRKELLYSDSDNSLPVRPIKTEPAETTDDEIKSKHALFKSLKSRITSDTSDDEYHKTKISNKLISNDYHEKKVNDISDLFSENDAEADLGVKSEKITSVKTELERLVKKERRNSKFQDISPVEHQSFDVLHAEPTEVKTDKVNNRSVFENTTDDDLGEIKKEKSEKREKKHKKKQKKQRHLASNEVSCKNETDLAQGEVPEKKHHEKRKDHSKKDKKRDKTKEGREKSKKSKKNKTEDKSESKREGKMENIFGSLSEDSEPGNKEQKMSFLVDENAQSSSVFHTDSEKEPEVKSQEEKDREAEHKKRKEKKRKEKERRLQEAAAEAAAAAAEEPPNSNENSMDFADMGKQLEANIKDDTSEIEYKTELEVSNVETSDTVTCTDQEVKKEKEERKEGKEKKKKRKKSKDEKKHHHHHHHDKNKVKTPEIKTETAEPPLTVTIPEIKTEPVEEEVKPSTPSSSHSQSLPSLLDAQSPTEKSSPDFIISPSIREMAPLISPIPKTPTSSKVKREKLIPGFGTEIDETLHENAVKSISTEFEPSHKIEEPVLKEEIKEEVVPEPSEDKPRVVISQEETEDAVAALLGESFSSSQFDERYTEEINTTSEEVAPELVEEQNVQDDEEMRKAVQSLEVDGDISKPSTPQSEHELQIDTDTEEQDEPAQSNEQTPKTSETPTLGLASKTPDSQYYPSSNEKVATPASLSYKTLSSPPSLTPIKPLPSALAEVRKNLEKEQKGLSMLPEAQPTQRSVIAQTWPIERKEIVLSKTDAVPSASTSVHQKSFVTSSTIKIGEPNYPPLAKLTPLVESKVQPSVSAMQSTMPSVQTPTKPLVQPSVQPMSPSPSLQGSGKSHIQTSLLSLQSSLVSIAPPTKPQTHATISSVQSSSPSVLTFTKVQTSLPSVQSSAPSVQTLTKPQVVSQLHNLPARSPVQICKPALPEGMLSPKSSGNVLSRLPITPVMVSKPLQATTVYLPQSKVAHSSEPPKLVSTADIRTQERPRMIFQSSSVPPYAAFSPGQSPRMLVQGNIRHLPPTGLLVPTRHINPVNYGFMGPHSSAYVPLPSKETPNQLEGHLKLASTSAGGEQIKSTIVMAGSHGAHTPSPPRTPCSPVMNPPHLVLTCPKSTPTSSALSPRSLAPMQSPNSSQTFVAPPSPRHSPKPIPVIMEGPHRSVSPSPERKSPLVSQEPPKAPTPDTVPGFPAPDSKTKEVVHLPLPSVEARRSTPSPVIVPNPEVKSEARPPSPVKLAIEKVTEELNMSLEKKEEIKDEAKEKDSVEEKVKDEITEDNKSLIKPVREEVKCSEIPLVPENTVSKVEEPTNKPSEEAKISETLPSKEEPEKPKQLEMVSLDLLNSSSERTTDLLTKDEDPLESKDDNDFWSSKDSVIDSVIKTLGSADEMSDDENKEPVELPKTPVTPKDNLVDEKDSPKSPEKKLEHSSSEEKHEEETEINVDSTDTHHNIEVSVTRSSARRGRGGRPRGSTKIKISVERAGIQTRRGKLKEAQAPPATPTKRGRGGKVRTERKSSKSESDSTANDVYEFRDDSDDCNKEQRPRLVLTIKSTTSSTSNAQTTAIVKEITKDGTKEIGKEVKEALPSKPKETPAENKEEFTSPQTNTRKSRRLAQRDTSRSSVDDTIEDVIKNTPLTRAASSQRRSGRQNKKPQPLVTPQTSVSDQDSLRKSPRGRKPSRRASEAADNSSSEDTKDDNPKSVELSVPPSPSVPLSPSQSKQPETEKPKEQPVNNLETSKEKKVDHCSLKTAMLKRFKGEMGNLKKPEPTNLIDPVTGVLIPMRESEEGKYIPLPGSSPGNKKVAVIPPTVQNEPAPVKANIEPTRTQASVVAQPHQITVVQQQVPKVHPLKAHVLSSPAAKAVVTEQPAVAQPKPLISNTVPAVVSQAKDLISQAPPPSPIVVSKPSTTVLISRSGTQVTQSSNISTSVNPQTVGPPSPRPGIPVAVTSKPQVKPPAISPSQQLLSTNQKHLLQAREQQIQQLQTAHMSSSITPQQAQIVNSQIAHLKHHRHEQVIMGAKGPITKSSHALHQQHLTGQIASPPVTKAQGSGRIIQGPPTPAGAKGVMEPPKIDVNLPNIMLGRPNLSPSGPQARLAGLPVPAYEASLGEPMPHFPPAQLRPPDLNPHYMHSQHMMYQQFLRQQQLQQHFQRSANLEKSGEEGEEAPVGLAVSGRGAAVPHHSPHDRATESPAIGQVYNTLPHTARLPPYHPGTRYFDQQPAEPPPAHRPLTSHDRAGLPHIPPLGTPDRPLGAHSAAHSSAHLIPDRPSGTIPERPLSAHLVHDRAPLGTPERSQTTYGPERPLVGAGLGAAGNLLGAVAKHIGVDAPASQRGIQAATPPLASQVPPQAESLFMLLKHYPLMWQGLLALKNDQAAVQMYFVSGNDDVAKCSLPKNTDGSTPPLRIFQRMRLEPMQVEGVARKMQMENEHCMLLALPCGHDHMDVLKQSTNLTTGFITYLQLKQAAGIVNVAAPGTTQPPAYVVHIFPSCDFVNENLRRIAPSLLERVADIAHLLIVITTV